MPAAASNGNDVVNSRAFRAAAVSAWLRQKPGDVFGCDAEDAIVRHTSATTVRTIPQQLPRMLNVCVIVTLCRFSPGVRIPLTKSGQNLCGSLRVVLSPTPLLFPSLVRSVVPGLRLAAAFWVVLSPLR
jgi:hypothetical protein